MPCFMLLSKHQPAQNETQGNGKLCARPYSRVSPASFTLIHLSPVISQRGLTWRVAVQPLHWGEHFIWFLKRAWARDLRYCCCTVAVTNPIVGTIACVFLSICWELYRFSPWERIKHTQSNDVFVFQCCAPLVKVDHKRGTTWARWLTIQCVHGRAVWWVDKVWLNADLSARLIQFS